MPADVPGLELFDSAQESMLVDARLKGVCYDVDPGYVPSDFALGFVTFIKLANGEDGEENKTPVIHYKMLDTLVSGDPRIANLCFRGSAKTTIKEYLILYLAVYGHLPGFGSVSLGIYVSDSIENGVKNMRKNLEHRWENSDFLREYLPGHRFTDVRWEFTNADGRKLIVKAYGAATGVRGVKELGMRPQFALLDDLVSDEDARSATVIAAIEDTVYKAIEYALHPKKNFIIWSGTPFNSRDPLYKAVESGAWTVNVFPVCEEFPCNEADFKGAWSDRFNYQYVKTQYEKAALLGKVDTFNQELMLRIMSDEDRLVRDEDIRWYGWDLVAKDRHRFNFYITTDFATSTKDSSDFSVLSVWGLSHSGDWYWVDGVCKRQLMNQNVNDLFRLAASWQAISAGVEVSGQQGGFVDWIQDEMIRRNQWFTLASEPGSTRPGLRPTTDKMVRFNAVLPLIKAGKVHFPREHKDHPAMIEMQSELSLASPSGFRSKHDDFIDTMSQLPLLGAWRPSESEPEQSKNSSENRYWSDDTIEDEQSSFSSYIV